MAFRSITNEKKVEEIFDIQLQLDNIVERRFFDSRIDILDELN